MFCKSAHRLTALDEFNMWWRHSVVVSTLASIDVINQQWAWLLFGWVMSCGQGNCYKLWYVMSGYIISHLGQLGLPSLRDT